MGMMKTLWIIQTEMMAEKGKQKYGVRIGRGKNAQAVVYVEKREQAQEIADALNRTRRNGCPPYTTCFGPDSFFKWLALPLFGRSNTELLF